MSEHHESNRAFYDRISAAYDLISNASEKPMRLAGVRALDVQPGEKVLEVGYGTGNEVLDMGALVGPAGLVAGIDVSTGMQAVSLRKIADKGLATPVDLRVGDARSLPFADGAFDAAFSSFTLELFPEEDIAVVLAEIRRVLRPGGRVGIVSMASVKAGEKASFLEKTYIWMHRHFPHIVDCRPIDPESVVCAAGFRVKSSSVMPIWSMPVGIVVGEKV